MKTYSVPKLQNGNSQKRSDSKFSDSPIKPSPTVWLLSSDNETIFRKIVRRLVNIDNAQSGETLASQVAFQNVMKTVQLNDVEPQIYWYVNPFGYLQLAQAIAREKEEFNQSSNDDWARILKKIGFDGFKGVGGYIAFATGQHEMMHRTFVYKPTSEDQDVKQKASLWFV